VPRVAWLAAAFVAVLFIGLQTDVIGIPWIAVAVWALAGDAVGLGSRSWSPARATRTVTSSQQS
jgi:hypothetical protein